MHISEALALAVRTNTWPAVLASLRCKAERLVALGDPEHDRIGRIPQPVQPGAIAISPAYELADFLDALMFAEAKAAAERIDLDGLAKTASARVQTSAPYTTWEGGYQLALGLQFARAARVDLTADAAGVVTMSEETWRGLQRVVSCLGLAGRIAAAAEKLGLGNAWLDPTASSPLPHADRVDGELLGAEKGVPLPTRSKTADGEELDVPAHCAFSPDFRSIRWDGKEYNLPPMPAAIVRQLWKTYVNGTPDVGLETLLDKAGSSSERPRLHDVFKSVQNWQQLVVKGKSKGAYRLAPLTKK